MMNGAENYRLVFATGNKGKFTMLEKALQNSDVTGIDLVMQDMELVEIQDDSVAVISRRKAEQAWNKIRKPVLVHDSGLNIPAFGGFPGPYTKYISKTLGPQGFVDLLKDKSDKRMVFYNCITFVDEKGNTHQFEDDTGDNIEISDYVSSKSRNDQWSDMWKVIIPKGFGINKTLSEMNDNEFADYMNLRTMAGTDGAYKTFIEFLKKSVLKEDLKTGTLN